ncbi:hypothetical protein LguiA_001981 [Lonicera macranthoides]
MALMEAPTFCSPLCSHDDAISPVAHFESKPIVNLELQKSSPLRADLSGDQNQQLDEQDPKLGNSESEEVYIHKSSEPESKIGQETICCESDLVNDDEDLESELTNMESRLDVLEFKVHDFQSDVDDFKSQAHDPKAEVLGLKAQVLDLKSKVPKRRSQVPTLTVVVVDLKPPQVNDLKVVDPDLKSQVHALKAKFLNLRSRIFDLLSPGFKIRTCCLNLEFLFLRPHKLWLLPFYKGM